MWLLYILPRISYVIRPVIVVSAIVHIRGQDQISYNLTGGSGSDIKSTHRGLDL